MNAMTPRERLAIMARTDRGSMTVWSPAEVRDAIDAFRAQVRREVLREAADAADCLKREDVATPTTTPDATWYDGLAVAVQLLRRMADAAGKDTPRGESTRADVEPSACATCDLPRLSHARQWIEGSGWHTWQRPSDAQTKGRMLARRVARGKSTRDADTAPDFFQPGRTYAYDADGFTAPELITLFRVEHLTTHPETGKRMAWGWIRTAPDVTWSPYAEPSDEWPESWTEVPEGGGDRG
jgi:hypothetical protein